MTGGATEGRPQPQPAPSGGQRALGGGLHGEIRRGQLLDRDLARHLGRPDPVRSGGAGDYIEALGRRAVLPEATERRLVQAAQAGDPAARAQLVEACMPLISAAARTYRSGQVQRLELLQEGVVGLLRALGRFDPEFGTPFWAYACWWVRQAMQQLVSDLTHAAVLSDRAQRGLALIRDTRENHLQAHGQEPSTGDLAAATELPRDQVQRLVAVDRTPRGLEEPIARDDGPAATLEDLITDPLAQAESEAVIDRLEIEEVRHLTAGLGDRERMIIYDHYGLGRRAKTLTQIGEDLGLSGERVRQIEERSLCQIRAGLAQG